MALKHIEDFLQKCFCGRVLAKSKEDEANITSLVYECEECGYTYSINFEDLLEV